MHDFLMSEGKSVELVYKELQRKVAAFNEARNPMMALWLKGDKPPPKKSEVRKALDMAMYDLCVTAKFFVEARDHARTVAALDAHNKASKSRKKR